MGSTTRGYLEPKVGDPSMMRKRKNGQAVNPPTYMDMGGLTGPSKLNRSEGGIMNLEKGGPQARKGKPI